MKLGGLIAVAVIALLLLCVGGCLVGNYNRLVTLPYAASHEEMWLADGLYDLVVVIGYNTDPVVPGRGSAIFLHVARPDFSPTAGCIAIARDPLAALLGLLGPGSTITIRA